MSAPDKSHEGRIAHEPSPTDHLQMTGSTLRSATNEIPIRASSGTPPAPRITYKCGDHHCLVRNMLQRHLKTLFAKPTAYEIDRQSAIIEALVKQDIALGWARKKLRDQLEFWKLEMYITGITTVTPAQVAALADELDIITGDRKVHQDAGNAAYLSSIAATKVQP